MPRFALTSLLLFVFIAVVLIRISLAKDPLSATVKKNKSDQENSLIARKIQKNTREEFNFEEASQGVLKPKEIWPHVKKHMVAMDAKILEDKIIASDTDPKKKLRKVTAQFNSQNLDGKLWIHPCTILMPADSRVNQTPQRQGKIVIMGTTDEPHLSVHVAKYAEPIVSKTDYPVMILSNPGRYKNGTYIENQMGDLNRLRRKTGENYYSMNCQLAVVYIQAMNFMEKLLKVDRVHAILGGHSKRGRSATVAAAMDSRVASSIIMGNEGIHSKKRIQWHLSFHHAFFQDQVNVPVFYLGATNEDGYKMFNINIMQERLKRPMTIEMVPNYNHITLSEIQFIDFLMWVAHVFDGRPISKISELSHHRQAGQSIFRARIKSEAKVQMVRVWFVYTDDPQWRDLMWYHVLMKPTEDGRYEASLPGKMPDAYMIEVADISQGVPGYVSSLPQKLSDAEVVWRRSRGSKPRLWKPVQPKQ